MKTNSLGDQEDYVLQKFQAWVRAFIQKNWGCERRKNLSITKIWGHSLWSGVYKSETDAKKKLGLTSILQMKFLFGFEPSASLLCLIVINLWNREHFPFRALNILST